jgi:hypothetical protein
MVIYLVSFNYVTYTLTSTTQNTEGMSIHCAFNSIYLQIIQVKNHTLFKRDILAVPSSLCHFTENCAIFKYVGRLLQR